MKKSLMILLLASIMLLCSCEEGAGRMSIFDDGDKKANTRTEQIIEALKNEDKAALKAVFSKQALDDADDFDGSMEYLFEFFQGNIESWEQSGFTSETSRESGKKSVMLISWYNVTTDSDKYRFFVIDYSEDSFNKNNIGVYALRVIKAVDEETQFTYWQDMNIAGIYKPE